MYRILYFLMIIIIPVIWSWWLFIPMALLFIFLAKLPVELILAGFMLDMVYYFGEGFWVKYPLTIFSIFLLLTAFFLSKRIHWRKII